MNGAGRGLAFVAAAAVAMLVSSPAKAEVCAAPAALARLTDALPKTRARLAAHRSLKVVALGSSSTAGAGASATRFTYPSQLAVALAQREPTATIEIVNRGQNGEDAWDNVKRLDGDVLSARPDLVIWQMGTNAILHDIDYDDFDRTVQGGLDRMRAAGIEVLLMDLQYAPRVTEVPDHERMLAHFDALGSRNHVAVFHRYALMRYWAQTMRADYVTMLSSDGLHLNDRSYGCLAERLADAIVGEPSSPSPPTASASDPRAAAIR